jgi:hypothetical protein
MYVKKILFYLWRLSGRAELPKIEQYKGGKRGRTSLRTLGEARPGGATGRSVGSSHGTADGAYRRSMPTEAAERKTSAH